MMKADIRTASRFALDRLLEGFGEATLRPGPEISGLAHDSRRVASGDLFFALAGHRSHGLRHAEQARQQGCAAIAYDPAGGGDLLARGIGGIPCIPIRALDQKLGCIADRFFGEPSAAMTAVAVTGTNGKTSCSHFLAQALSAGRPSAVVGTLGWGAPGDLEATTHTTPDAIEVHAILSRLRERGYGSVAMEASSHGLAQGRLNGVRFKGALYTNFTRDHLDYHGTMEAYLEAKLRLLAHPGLEFVVFNADDPVGAAVLARKPTHLPAFAFSISGTGPEAVPRVTLSDLVHGSEGVRFIVHWAGETASVATPLFGDFNVENLLGALTVLLALGMNLSEAAAALGRVRPVAGRMERIAAAGRTVIVDYAHTPDALVSVLGSLRCHCRGRLWVVFGCGGDRDRGKRPQMGAIAERFADHVVLTDDNPRSEDGDAIIDEILSGCARGEAVRIRDRRTAIAFALERAGAGDLVLVAGKGHETTQEILGQRHPFDDRAVVRSVLAELGTPT